MKILIRLLSLFLLCLLLTINTTAEARKGKTSSPKISKTTSVKGSTSRNSFFSFKKAATATAVGAAAIATTTHATAAENPDSTDAALAKAAKTQQAKMAWQQRNAVTTAPTPDAKVPMPDVKVPTYPSHPEKYPVQQTVTPTPIYIPPQRNNHTVIFIPPTQPSVSYTIPSQTNRNRSVVNHETAASSSSLKTFFWLCFWVGIIALILFWLMKKRTPETLYRL